MRDRRARLMCSETHIDSLYDPHWPKRYPGLQNGTCRRVILITSMHGGVQRATAAPALNCAPCVQALKVVLRGAARATHK